MTMTCDGNGKLVRRFPHLLLIMVPNLTRYHILHLTHLYTLPALIIIIIALFTNGLTPDYPLSTTNQIFHLFRRSSNHHRLLTHHSFATHHYASRMMACPPHTTRTSRSPSAACLTHQQRSGLRQQPPWPIPELMSVSLTMHQSLSTFRI